VEEPAVIDGLTFMLSSRLLELLHRAFDGEDPDLLMLEVYANAEHVPYEPEGGEDD
jgi:hypothetical protein